MCSTVCECEQRKEREDISREETEKEIVIWCRCEFVPATIKKK